MSITSMTNRARMAENLTIEQLQQSIKDGVVPSYIGVPLLKSKVEDAKLLQAAKMAQGMSQQPSVAQQIMAQAQQVDQGVEALPTNLPEAAMAGGGIVAFAEGGMYDDDEDSYDNRMDAALRAEADSLMDEYAKTFQGGIGQLPAAAAAAPSDREGIAGGDVSDFIAKIMHKESRGRRYGRDGELLTSEKGAKGEMQVMPGTSRDPGFGVKPARDNSPDELARVGRDYAQTLLARYGDPKLAAIAYNMGPGATDKWLAAGADVSKLPKETQGYVKGFANGGEVKRFANGALVYNPETGMMEEEVVREGLGDKFLRAINYKQGLTAGDDMPGMAKAKEQVADALAARNAPVASKAKVETKPAAVPAVPAVVANPEYSEDLMRQFDQAGERYMAEREAAAKAPGQPAEEEKVDQFAGIRDLLKKRYEGLEKQREQDKYLAMLQAGLGMMGGTSQHGLANIGAGAMQGVKSLAESNAARTAEANALLSGELGLSKLGATERQAAEMRKLRADLQKDVLAQRSEQQKASNALGQARLEETHASNIDRQLEAMKKLAVTKLIADKKNVFTEADREKAEAEALMSLYKDPQYRRLYKERNNLDPITFLNQPLTQAQSSNQGLYDRANAILTGK